MEKRGEVTKARGRGRQWEEDGEDMEVRETGMHEKNSPKTQPIWLLGMPLGATALSYTPCHTFLESCFQGQQCRRRWCLCLEPFKSNRPRASNLTIALYLTRT